jgi:hypothetical protein
MPNCGDASRHESRDFIDGTAYDAAMLKPLAAVGALCMLIGLNALARPDSPTTRQADDYPLSQCVISGDPLPDNATAQTIDGRPVKFCCAGCVEAFSKDLPGSHKKMDELVVAAQSDTYPSKDCAVSGEPLGSMGEPIMHVDRASNTLIKLCCKGCLKSAKKDAATLVEKIKKARLEK